MGQAIYMQACTPTAPAWRIRHRSAAESRQHGDCSLLLCVPHSSRSLACFWSVVLWLVQGSLYSNRRVCR